jgi:hypothetical protein
MKKRFIYIIILYVSFANAQNNQSNFFYLYKGGEKIEKTTKHIYFDQSIEGYEKKTVNGLIYFYCIDETFFFKPNKNKKTEITLQLDKITFQNPMILKQEAYAFYKSKKEKEEKKKKRKLVYPPSTFNFVFQVYLYEKLTNEKYIRYEVEWKD